MDFIEIIKDEFRKEAELLTCKCIKKGWDVITCECHDDTYGCGNCPKKDKSRVIAG